MTQSAPTRWRRTLTALVTLSLGAAGVVAASPAPAGAAVGDTMIAWLEVENGVIAGNPGRDQGDHGNFAGTSSYTFRDPGMRSTMSFTAPEAGTYPVWIRYSAGGLGTAEDDNVVRKMGLLVNGGSRQRLDFPATFVPGEADQHDGWERWSWTRTDVTLTAGANTLAVDCQRDLSVGETCRLNFDAIQVGGTAPTGGTPAAPCTASTAIPTGATRLFDGTFASFDGTIAAPKWHKQGAGGFGFQTDCTLRGLRGQGTTWTLAQHSGPYTLGVDFLRGAASSASSVYVGSTTNGSPNPTGGYQVRIGAGDTGTIVTGDGSLTTAPDAAALAAALRPQGQWNSFAIQVTPARIRVLLNGTAVNAVDRTAPMTGYVGLENRAGDDAVSDVRFRNIYHATGVVLGRAATVRRATLADGTTANRGGESTLGNLVADSQRWATRTAGGARLALASPTRLQSDLVAAGGGLTYAQVAAAVSDEPVVTMRLTGARLKAILEQQWQPADATPGFVRLGASSGFTWTEDATRPVGDRITGMWLDGAEVPLTGTGNIVVAAAQSLAAGGDNFTGFAGGTQTARTGTVAALAAYVGDRSVSAPLTAPSAQAAVDVHVPGGAPTSYVAGTTYAVDLASWSYAGAGDPVDSTVEVSVGNRAIGTFAVDNTVTDDPTDRHGRVAVRATLPADLPSGATTVRIVGTTTGTTVQRPIVVTAAPANPDPTPDPEPTPDPTPNPTPNPTPTPQTGPSPTLPAPTKARPSLKVAVKPGKVVARRTRARLVVTVSSDASTPTGKVTVRVGKVRLEQRLRRGRATVRLPAFAKRGASRVTVSYAGDARTLTATRTLRINAVAS